MTREEHHLLADFIKGVHQNLRTQSRIFGDEAAWKVHCDQQDVLQKYAVSMKQLATKFWDPNAEDQNKKASSRIEWVAERAKEYFLGDGKLKERLKEERKWLSYQKSQNTTNSVTGKDIQNNFIGSRVNETETKCDDASQVVLDVLDVGSCYNPFKNYTFFKVMGIDLVPACTDVYQCDFLNVNVNVGLTTCRANQQPPEVNFIITDLSESAFDIVIFSLLLEYLPSPKQRFQSCLKAYRLLKPEGILFIVTPDSKNPSANAPLMKSWRIALAYIGFVRVYYDKLTHIHCMAYRKSLCPALAKQLGMSMQHRSKKPNSPEELMKIPQDLQEINPDPVSVGLLDFARTDKDNELLTYMFNELPDVL